MGESVVISHKALLELLTWDPFFEKCKAIHEQLDEKLDHLDSLLAPSIHYHLAHRALIVLIVLIVDVGCRVEAAARLADARFTVLTDLLTGLTHDIADLRRVLDPILRKRRAHVCLAAPTTPPASPGIENDPQGDRPLASRGGAPL